MPILDLSRSLGLRMSDFGIYPNSGRDLTVFVQALIDRFNGYSFVFDRPGEYIIDTIADNTGTGGTLKWCVSIKSDNTILYGVPGAYVKTNQDAAIFFFAGPARNGIGFTNFETQRWGPTLTVYPITGSYAKGVMSVTLTTPADVTTMGLVPGSRVILRTGQTNNGSVNQPDGEILEVLTASAGTGVVTFTRPTSKPYAQEYFIAGTTGKTSTSVTANLALYGLANIDPYWLKNVGIVGLEIRAESLTTQNPFICMHCENLKIEDVKIRTSRNGFDVWGLYRYIFRNIEVVHMVAGTWWNIPAGATCQTHGFVKDIIATAPLGVTYIHLHEGSAKITVDGASCFCGVSGASNGPVSIRARGYDLKFINGMVYSKGSVTAVFADETVIGGLLIDNTWIHNEAGGAVRLAGANQKFGANNRVTLGDVAIQQSSGAGVDGPLAPGTVETLYNWVTPTVQNPTLGDLPPGAYALRVHCHVIIAFDSSGTDQITVGWDAGVSALATAIDVSTTGIKTVTLGVSAGYRATGAGKSIEAYYTAGGGAPTVGRALIIVEYCRVPLQPT